MKNLKFAKSIPTSIIAVLLVISVSALSIFAAVSFIPSGADPDGDGVTATGVPVYVPEKRTYTRPEETYEGVQGIILRSAASAVNISEISGTQVTDYMIIADSTSPDSEIISALKDAGINAWISIPLTDVDASMVSSITSILSANDVDGIELDFCGMPSNPGESNSDVDAITAFMTTVRGVVDQYEASRDRDIKLSAKVYCDINTNYGYGIDVAAWVADDLVDMITPSSGFEFTNTDMSLRLWASLLDPYGVVLAPHIGGTIKNYESATTTTVQTKESLAGEAVFAISQGADKISVETYVDKSMLNIIGSYDTVMKVDRTHFVTYNSVRQSWTPTYNPLPGVFSKEYKVIDGHLQTVITNANFRIPMGNVPEGATVKVRITYDTAYSKNSPPSPSVYVNSKECTGRTPVGSSWWNNFTTFEYNVPTEVLDGGYAVLELIPTSYGKYTLTEVQIVVDVP